MALPLPSFYRRSDADKQFFPHSRQIIQEAQAVRKQHNIQPAHLSPHERRVIFVDPQNTFCEVIDGEFELLVANAPEHLANGAEFLYKYADKIEEVVVTIDSHSMWQIDCPGWWVDRQGNIVTDNVQISYADFKRGDYDVNPQMEFLNSAGLDYKTLRAYTAEYLKAVEAERGEVHAKWMAHAQVFSISHAVAPILYDALMYWEVVRGAKVHWHVKGSNDLSQRYSPIREQVLNVGGASVGTIDLDWIKQLARQKNGHYVNWILGEASSHCVYWMIKDLYQQLALIDPNLTTSITPLVDCMGPVIIPGVIDFTYLQAELFQFCQDNGMALLEACKADQWIGKVS